MDEHLLGDIRGIVLEPLRPVVPDSICEHVALCAEFCCRDRVVARIEPLELLLGGFVPEDKGAVAPGGGEGLAVEGMEVY